MPSNVIFDRHEAVARLVRQYVNYCKSVEGVDVREEEDVIENDASLLKEDYIVELTRVLQLFMVSKNSVRNLNLLCFLKLIAHVLGDDKLKERLLHPLLDLDAGIYQRGGAHDLEFHGNRK